MNPTSDRRKLFFAATSNLQLRPIVPSAPDELAALTAIRRACPGLEAVTWTPADARYLLLTNSTLASAKIMANATWVRLLLEPWETNPVHANAVVDQLEAVLKALPHVPRLLHGTDAA